MQGIEGSEELFSLQPVLSMCQLDLTLRSIPHVFADNCALSDNNTCCRSWTLSNYVAANSGKSSCEDVTEEDVKLLKQLVSNCSQYYQNRTLNSSCYRTKCPGVPKACGLAFEVLHYIADINLLSPVSNMQGLTYTMMFLPIATGSGVEEYYKAIPQHALQTPTVSVVAMDFGLKYDLFQEYLKSDTVYVGLASGSVVFFMLLYTHSLFITLMMAASMAFSIIIAYFFYSMIFEFTFFPFVNLLAIILVVALGADDVFIYCKIWAVAKSEKNNGVFEKVIADTLHHSTRSMFVSSLTTAAALYGSYVSSITALRCFSIFAGTAVLINFFFMVTWLPASIVIHDKWLTNYCACGPEVFAPEGSLRYYVALILKPLCSLCNTVTDWSRVFFETFLPCIVIKARFVWMLIFIGAAIGSCIVIFYKPKLNLPDVDYFPFFDALNPFELYDRKFRDIFWFEKELQEASSWQLPIKVVWGVQPLDNGDHLDPYKTGVLHFDSTFDFEKPTSQVWMLNFCIQLRNQTFFQPTFGPQLTDCFIERFKDWMEKPCIALDHSSNDPCCRVSPFPFSKAVFNSCLSKYIESLQHTPTYHSHRGVGGPRFLTDSGVVQSVILEFNSNYSFTYKYQPMDQFYNQIETWVTEKLKSAPPGLKHGWFISDLAFYDLQKSLSHGTFTAFAVALSVAFLVLFLTTLNVLVSVYAIFVITCIMSVTVGSLTLLGWKLNILESSTFTIAVGLSVDFTLHYIVAFQLSSETDRESRVLYSLSRVGCPVALAAFTTFFAGLLMLPSNVLAYQQLGLFLVLIMTVSWLYSSLMLQSILSICGPNRNFGQFHWPNLDCCASPAHHVDKTVYSTSAISDSTRSSSSVTVGNPSHSTISEAYELEPLARKPTEIHLHHHHHHHHYRYKPRHSAGAIVLQQREQSTSSSAHTSSTLLCADEDFPKEVELSPKDDKKDPEKDKPEVVWLRRKTAV